jgi:hypothetical protein
MSAYQIAENEVDIFLADFKKKDIHVETTKELFRKRFNTLKDLVMGDFYIRSGISSTPIFIDAKRNGWVSENSINNFAGDYYMFYYPENNTVEFVEANTVKKYYEKIDKKMTMPSGDIGFCFKKGTFKKALPMDDFLKQVVYAG